MSQNPEFEREVREVHRTLRRQILKYKARLREWGVGTPLLDPALVLCEDLIEHPYELVEISLDLPSSQSYYS